MTDLAYLLLGLLLGFLAIALALAGGGRSTHSASRAAASRRRRHERRARAARLRRVRTDVRPGRPLPPTTTSATPARAHLGPQQGSPQVVSAEVAEALHRDVEAFLRTSGTSGTGPTGAEP